jgi:hypothetical protein
MTSQEIPTFRLTFKDPDTHSYVDIDNMIEAAKYADLLGRCIRIEEVEFFEGEWVLV